MVVTTFRSAIPDFQLANPIYAGATASFYTVDDDGNRTNTLATLYANPTGLQTLSNPQTLDADGKFAFPVYFSQPLIAVVSGAGIGTQTTGIINMRPTWRGDWVTATVYYSGDFIQDGTSGNLYVAATDYTSGASVAADVLAGNLILLMQVSAAPVTLTDAATVTPDFSAGINFVWTIGAAGRTLANPTNMTVGQAGIIYVVQDGTGNRTITGWGSYYKFGGGVKPTLSTTAGAVDTIAYAVKSATEIVCYFTGLLT